MARRHKGFLLLLFTLGAHKFFLLFLASSRLSCVTSISHVLWGAGRDLGNHYLSANSCWGARTERQYVSSASTPPLGFCSTLRYTAAHEIYRRKADASSNFPFCFLLRLANYKFPETVAQRLSAGRTAFPARCRYCRRSSHFLLCASDVTPSTLLSNSESVGTSLNVGPPSHSVWLSSERSAPQRLADNLSRFYRKCWVWRRDSVPEKTFSQFVDHMEKGKVGAVDISEKEVKYWKKPVSDSAWWQFGRRELSSSPETCNRAVVIPGILEDVVNALRKRKIPFKFVEAKRSIFRRALSHPLLWASLTLLVGGASLAAWFDDDTGQLKQGDFQNVFSKPVSFDDIIGVDKAKSQVTEVVDMLRSPSKYDAAGARIPRGVLLIGPPGTGKTLLARAMANSAKLPFLYATGSDFVEVYAGRGASRIRSLFEKAHMLAPSVLFIDEVDALGKRRARGSTSGSAGSNRWNDLNAVESQDEEYVQTLNALLSCMDGMDSRSGKPVVVMAATNRYGVLDGALTRPGRFDRVVDVRLPDVAGRREILKFYAQRCTVDSGVNYQQLAEDCVELSPADIELVVNEAAINAVRNSRQQVLQQDLDNALIQVLSRGSGGSDGSADFDFTDQAGVGATVSPAPQRNGRNSRDL